MPLSEALALVRQMESKGADGLPAEAIGAALGYRNIRTHGLSAPLSAARQFGLIELRDGGYRLTRRGRRLLRPTNAAEGAALRREAMLASELYATLAMKLAGKRLPDEAALAGWLQRDFRISASARLHAAQVFVASAREAGLVDDAGLVRLDDTARTDERSLEGSDSDENHGGACDEVEATLRLWADDEGKMVRIRAPGSMSRASFERLVEALRLLVRVGER